MRDPWVSRLQEPAFRFRARKTKVQRICCQFQETNKGIPCVLRRSLRVVHLVQLPLRRKTLHRRHAGRPMTPSFPRAFGFSSVVLSFCDLASSCQRHQKPPQEFGRLVLEAVFLYLGYWPLSKATPLNFILLTCMGCSLRLLSTQQRSSDRESSQRPRQWSSIRLKTACESHTYVTHASMDKTSVSKRRATKSPVDPDLRLGVLCQPV